MADIVLVHGITESKHSWDPLLPLLADHRVLAVDLRGHGADRSGAPYDLGTMAGDVFAAMSVAGFAPETSVLVGHSLGGTVVSAMASSTGVGGVVNVDQPLDLASFQDGLRQLQPMLEGDEASFRAAIGMVFDSMRGPLSAPEVARIEGLRDPRQEVVLAIWAPVLHASLDDLNALVSGMASAIKVPYLSLHGIDPGPHYGDWLKRLIPSATVEQWPDSGHYPHLVDPTRFVARLNAFVETLA